LESEVFVPAGELLVGLSLVEGEAVKVDVAWTLEEKGRGRAQISGCLGVTLTLDMTQ
jgi:hypothetical protein